MIDVDGMVSIIMPGYNEVDKIYDNLFEADRVLSGIFDNFEITFVKDGSNDNSLEMALKAKKEFSRINVIDSTVKYGKSTALCDGTEAARGQYIDFMESNLDLPGCAIEPVF